MDSFKFQDTSGLGSQTVKASPVWQMLSILSDG